VTEGQTDWKKVEEEDLCGDGTCVWMKTGMRGKNRCRWKGWNAINKDFVITYEGWNYSGNYLFTTDTK